MRFSHPLLFSLLISVSPLPALAAIDNQVPAIPGATIEAVQPPQIEDKDPEMKTETVKVEGMKAQLPAPKAGGKKTPEDKLLELQVRIDELEQRAKIAEAIGNSTQKPSTARFIGADTVYNYSDGGVYRVYGATGEITDIALQPGETITGDTVNNVISGDTVRWIVSMVKSGKAPNEVTHVILKPTYDDIRTTIFIPTDKHTYKLVAQSSNRFYMPGVRFNYPSDEALKLSHSTEVTKKFEMENTPTSLSPEKMDFNYTISGSNVPWKPAQVFNDGEKTYIKMSPAMKTSEAPAFFVLDENNNTMLVNYRVKDGVYIVDRLFKTGVLKIGEQEVHISSGGTSFLERNYPRSGK